MQERIYRPKQINSLFIESRIYCYVNVDNFKIGLCPILQKLLEFPGKPDCKSHFQWLHILFLFHQQYELLMNLSKFQTVILWRTGKRPFIVLFDFVSLQLVIYIFKVFSYFFPLQLALFPPQALVSPVADVLRQKLSVVAWGRRGLGLPSKEKNKQKDTVRKSYFGFGVLVIAVTVLFFSLSCMEFL